MRTRTLSALLAAAVAVASLTACTSVADVLPSREAPQPAQSGSSVSALPDATTVVPRSAVTMDGYEPGASGLPPAPPEMDRDDEVGATAAAAYFVVDALPVLEWLGDPAPYSAMSASSCDVCSTTLATGSAPRDPLGPGAKQLPQEWAWASVLQRDEVTYVVTLGLESRTTETYSETGALELTIETGVADREVTLTRADGTWLVLDHREISAEESDALWQAVADSGAVPPPPSEPMDLPTRSPLDLGRPVPPAAMSRQDDRGAEAAALYFAGDLRWYTAASQDLVEYQAMSGTECLACLAFPFAIAEQQYAGNYLVPGELEARLGGSQRVDAGSVSVSIHTEGGSSELRSSSGEQLGVWPPFSNDLTYLMVYDGTRWRVSDISEG